ncbi:hypothetical protein XA68_14133 [Ophiocordyceps unilateralis]|uniref:AB hydrolase-1 domain-containing protein n=1 Tax=Ophiocordyceps unilateralis TaxID=268505 RepID=A0A2A9P9Y2_OPHUN|nr:hypothetical protein XA68_14133 [Ophiocordyceps unilateralis]
MGKRLVAGDYRVLFKGKAKRKSRKPHDSVDPKTSPSQSLSFWNAQDLPHRIEENALVILYAVSSSSGRRRDWLSSAGKLSLFRLACFPQLPAVRVMMGMHKLLRTAALLLVAPYAIYVVILFLLAVPVVQRHALYAHKINDLFWTDLNGPEAWGFASNQVTPFTIATPDGESVYAWHITPLPLYLKNEVRLTAQPSGLSPNFTNTESFRLLREDPNARLILYFHGTAGHIAQAVRPDSYHALTDTSSYHVVSIDYRGYGHSTGAPTEDGLIQDATALVDWALRVAGISPNRVVLLGHSLGTAVVSGVAEQYARKGIEFAGIVLVAGFSDLGSLIGGYRIGGLLPLLGPFAAWPALVRRLERFVVDRWHSSNRLASIVRHTKTRLRLNLIHARNDRDIPCSEGDKLFRAAANETVGIIDEAEFAAWKEQRTIRKRKDAFVTTWTSDPDIIVRQELFPYGAHDPIMSYAPVAMAIMRSFDYQGTAYMQTTDGQRRPWLRSHSSLEGP